MWGFLLGVHIVYIIYPFFEEWPQHRAAADFGFLTLIQSLQGFAL